MRGFKNGKAAEIRKRGACCYMKLEQQKEVASQMKNKKVVRLVFLVVLLTLPDTANGIGLLGQKTLVRRTHSQGLICGFRDIEGKYQKNPLLVEVDVNKCVMRC